MIRADRAFEAPTVDAQPRPLRERLALYLDLSKPRLTSLVLVTALVGFYLGSRRGVEMGLLLHTLFGMALAAAGASALNQYIERAEDARMHRTQGRPLPAGRLEPRQALFFGCATSAVGMAHLALSVNRVAAGLVALILVSYLFAYTPLKKRSTFCTLVGALPGALPPLVGWAAADGGIGAGGVILFAILFAWQMPHALAIACLYREDYERGGFMMLPVRTGENTLTGRLIVAHVFVLVPITLLPTLWGLAGTAYFWAALLLGLLFACVAIPVALDGSARAARRVLLASVTYLPALLLLLALDRRVTLP
ncbi:MAG TPA: heme o synthase [Candidatus Cryosericum sp.]|nr:heme o synthase [Candidatus Cryosericum sp.]